MRFLLTLAIAIALPFSASALSIGEAISLTLENDDAVKQYRSLAESQRYSRNASLALFLPSLDLEYQGVFTKLNHDNNTAVDGTDSDSGQLAASLGYNIFNGFADVYSVRMSMRAYDVQLLQYDAKKQDTIMNVKNAYINYLMAKDAVDIANETLKLLEMQRNTADISYQIGTLARTDVLQVEVQLAASKLELLNAQRAFKLAGKQLEKYIGRVLGEDEVVEDLTLGEYEIPPINDLYGYLESRRSEMIMVKKSEEAATMGARRSLSSFIPRVDAFANYTFYSDTYSPMNGRDGTTAGDYDSALSIGVRATWNIFQGFSSYNTYRSQAKSAMAAAYTVSDTRSSLRLALDDAYESYFTARELLSVAEVGLAQAEENYRVTKIQYDNSQATTTDLLNANVALNKARTALTAARYGIIAAVATLERAVEMDFLKIKYADPDA
jgi:outer membrane protein TolC